MSINFKNIQWGAAMGVLLLLAGCKKDFADINTNPSNVTTPEIKFLLSFSEERMATYQGTEWVWEGFEQTYRFTQHFTMSPYELTTNVNSRYGAYYGQILPNLAEIRRQIDLKDNKADYAKAKAVTYILGIMQGLKVTDLNGSIPYTEAMKGRYDGVFSPAFDNQQALFTAWLAELNTAITDLTAASTGSTVSYGTSDIIYKSDWTKWAKLANTLKLRIAARFENESAAKTAEIAKEVANSPVGPLQLSDDDAVYSSRDYDASGGSINYRDIKYGSTALINFMKKVNDPRTGVYFNPNDLVGSFKDTLTKYASTLPAFIDINDPLIQFQGGPVDWTLNAPQQNYFRNSFVVSPLNKYNLISTINRRFFAPRWDGSTAGTYTELLVGAAESCFLMAEFIKKGYATGDFNAWYNKGIEASIKSMNTIAKTAGSTTAFSGTGAAEIAAYQNNALVKLNGTNDLERIYIQQHVNLVREPNEAFVFCRRTGYPKTGSAYFGREVFNEPIPRRFWIDDPGEVNRANWTAAYSEQGFTPNVKDALSLSKERVWYDKKAPAFGAGN